MTQTVLNWHITESCNFSCLYCFAEWPNKPLGSEVWKDQDKRRTLLREIYNFFGTHDHFASVGLSCSAPIRLNIAGGEPTVLGKQLLLVIKEARAAGYSVSIITNGSNISLMRSLLPYIQMLGVSIDSASNTSNESIGRINKNKSTTNLDQIANLFRTANGGSSPIATKVNTVVNSINKDDDLSSVIERIRPSRWKIMRMLPIVGCQLNVSDTEYHKFLSRHQRFRKIIKTEDNSLLTQSYIMIDPYGRFFQNTPQFGQYILSRPILDVGAEAAFQDINFNANTYLSRYQV